MVAREVEYAGARLRELRVETRQHLGLAVAAFGLALGASRLHPALAVPLLFGGIFELFLCVRSASRHWDLLDRLVFERDAYVIPAVRRRAEEAATMRSRHALAASIHSLLSRPDLDATGRAHAAARELENLAAELADDRLALDPASAVACARLLDDPLASPLRNVTFPPEDVRSRIAQILAGFRPQGTADGA